MKSIMILLSTLVLLAMVFATAPTAPTIYGPVTWEKCYSIDPNYGTVSDSRYATAKADTLIGVDTMKVLNLYPVQPGWEYAVQIIDSTSPGDSIKVQLLQYSTSSNIMLKDQSTIIDTIGGNLTFKCIALPIGSTSYCDVISIWIVKWVATLHAKVYRVEVYRRRLATNATMFGR